MSAKIALKASSICVESVQLSEYRRYTELPFLYRRTSYLIAVNLMCIKLLLVAEVSQS